MLTRRASRELARFAAGLALIAALVACGSGNENADVGAGRQTTETVPTLAVTMSPDPTAEPAENRSEGIEGPYILRIPRIGVDAPVISIQSNEDRVLEPPRDPTVAGWWRDGAAPGESAGSAVLIGHTVRNQGGGVFDHVKALRAGDTIEVHGSDSALTYRVESVDVLSKEQVARNAQEIFAQTGPGRLVVITCDDWDGSVWRSNIVTIAAPV